MLWVSAAVAALAGTASAMHSNMIPRKAYATQKVAAASITSATFDQLIDHSNPSLGTFKQRYWYNSDYYGGPNSPIILESPGESSVNPDYIDPSSNSITGLYASKVNGATVTIEHRYFGESQPYSAPSNGTAETYQAMTLDNAIQDLIYFANNVQFDFAPNGTSKPDVAPWVLAGCSYSGALAAWTNAVAPGTFWAYHCGSAVVEAVADFWKYFQGVKSALPQNCTTDFARIVSHVDDVLANGTDQQKKDLKSQLANDSTLTDVGLAEFMTGWMGNWQNQQLYSGYTKPFKTCDYIENRYPGSKTTKNPGADGVGLQKALAGWSKAVHSSWFADPDYFGPDNAKSWDWFLCNEPFEWWQTYAQADTTGLIPKLYNTPAAIKEQCADVYPDTNGYTYGLKKGATVDRVNKHTGGWDKVNTKRLMWINGEFDPWRAATVSALDRPGGPLKSTTDAPVYLIPGAAHCNDFNPYNANANPAAKKIFDGMVNNIVKWVNEFYNQKKKAVRFEA